MKKIKIIVIVFLILLLLAAGTYYLAEVVEKGAKGARDKAKLASKKNYALSIAVDLELDCSDFPDRYESCDFRGKVKDHCSSDIEKCQKLIDLLEAKVQSADFH